MNILETKVSKRQQKLFYILRLAGERERCNVPFLGSTAINALMHYITICVPACGIECLLASYAGGFNCLYVKNTKYVNTKSNNM